MIGWLRRALDWRFLAALAAAIFLSLVAAWFVVQSQESRRAFDVLEEQERTQRDSRAAATRRIDALTGEISNLSNTALENQGLIARLVSEVVTLQEQLRREGVEPIIPNDPHAPPGAPQRRPEAPQSPPPPSPPPPSPPPADPPAEPCIVNIAGICL